MQKEKPRFEVIPNCAIAVNNSLESIQFALLRQIKHARR